MKDRIPTYAGRVKMTPVPNSPNTYDMERADEPKQEGTPLNSSTLLGTDILNELSLGQDATPADVFVMINSKLNSKAPAHTWGTEDIEAGSASTEPTGTLHLVIE